MTDLLLPWVYGIRSLALRTPEGPRTPKVPVAPPPGLEPPPLLPDEVNGYVRLAKHVSEWPSEGRTPPDLVHWREALPKERKVAENALRPLRPLLDGVDEALRMEQWQIPIPENGEWSELSSLRRLAQAMLLRGALDGTPDDRDRVVELARKLRRSQGPFILFLVSLSLEKAAQGSFEGIEQDRIAAVRWELARFMIPRAHRDGPWEPVDYESPPAWSDARQAVQYSVAGHPLPYDAEATVASLASEQHLMATGTEEELHRRLEEVGPPWPQSLYAPGYFGPGFASLLALSRTRKALREVTNPYGRLSLALTLRGAAQLATAVKNAGRT